MRRKIKVQYVISEKNFPVKDPLIRFLKENKLKKDSTRSYSNKDISLKYVEGKNPYYTGGGFPQVDPLGSQILLSSYPVYEIIIESENKEKIFNFINKLEKLLKEAMETLDSKAQ